MGTSNNEIMEFLMTLLSRDGIKKQDLTECKNAITHWNVIPLRIMVEQNIHRAFYPNHKSLKYLSKSNLLVVEKLLLRDSYNKKKNLMKKTNDATKFVKSILKSYDNQSINKLNKTKKDINNISGYKSDEEQ